MSSPPPPLPVWLDCDPGHDDALAIMLAAYAPGIRLLGLSTVHGNQTLAKTTLNARRVLAMAGVRGVRVAPGAAKPLLRPPRVCPEIHGDTGLDGPDLSAHGGEDDDAPQHAPAVVQMHAALRDAGQHATLVCTGALTNAALLLSVYPELAATLRVVFMGGAVRGGNTGAVAEFNIQLDPEAAAVVLSSGAHVTMVPLDVTHTALVTPDVLVRIRDGPAGSSSTRFRRVVAELLIYFASSYKTVFGFDSPPLHDPCAVLCALAPQLFELRHMRVDVETVSPLSYGQTVCDVLDQSRLAPNVRVALRMDVPEFWKHMHAALDAADARSPMNVVSTH
jgi:inosine-uridine nucleoside N-ribohydrolase